MSFDLHLEMAGMCLLVRKTNELLVLLPRTGAPGSAHHHVAVLGSDEIYQPDRDTTHGRPDGSSVYHDLGDGEILLDTQPKLPRLKLDFSRFDPADLRACAAGKVLPENAFFRMRLKHGEPCRTCVVRQGARWKPRPDAPPVHMGTMVDWLIPGLENVVDGKPGITVRVTPPGNAPYDVVFRPQGGKLKLFLYHTLADELPGRPRPAIEILPVGARARHFHHYFSLLGNGHICMEPTYWDRQVVFKFFGRRYSCIIGIADG